MMFLRYWPSPLSFAGDLIGAVLCLATPFVFQIIAWGLQ